jgi:hypothetical protein
LLNSAPHFLSSVDCTDTAVDFQISP